MPHRDTAPPPSPALERGLALLRAGRAGEALAALQQAHAGQPHEAAAVHALASALQQLGRHADAVQVYRDALEARPDDAALLTAAARALALAGDRPAALHLLQELHRGNRLPPAGAGLLGLLLREADAADAACEVLAPAVAAAPGNDALRWEYAQSLAAAERLDEAAELFAEHARRRPSDPLVPLALGRLATQQGRAGVAAAHFESALRLDPGNAAACWELANLAQFAVPAALRQRAQALLQRAPPARSALLLHDLLARAADASGEQRQAVGHATQANALHRLLLERSGRWRPAAEHVAEVDRLIDDYRADWFGALAGSGNPDPTPVFVIGLPRSGTTLVERMLAAHPHAAGVGEQSLARQALLRALAAAGSLHAIDTGGLRAAADWHLQELRERHLRQQRAATGKGAWAPTPARIVDKLPDNYLLAGWIALEFPAAALLHCLRDPRDVAISCWLAQYQQLEWTVDLDMIVQRIEQHRRLLRHWRTLLGPRLLEVRYEALVAEPEAQAGRLLGALDLEWDPAVLEHSARSGAVRSASQVQVRAPIHQRSVGRWRDYEDVLAPVMARLETIAEADRHNAPA